MCVDPKSTGMALKHLKIIQNLSPLITKIYENQGPQTTTILNVNSGVSGCYQKPLWAEVYTNGETVAPFITPLPKQNPTNNNLQAPWIHTFISV